MSTSLSRLERVYLQDQADFNLIPGGNAGGSGTATVGNSNCCRHIKVSLNNEIDVLVRRDKTGSRTATAGIRGRSFGRWSFEASLAPNGVAGTEPDFNPILKAVFGQAPTVGAGTTAITAATNATPIVITASGHGMNNGDLVTISGVGGNTAANGVWVIANKTSTTFELLGSVGNAAYTSGGTASKVNLKYSFVDDPILPFTMYSFRTPNTLAQRCAFGCVPQEMTLQLGQDIAEFSASGECKFVLDSDYFASASADEKGGISAFPSEPSTPVTNGGIIAGFTGRAVINGSTIARVRSATVKINNGGAVVKDNFGYVLPNELEGDNRDVTVAFSMYDTDEAAVKAIRSAAITKTGVDFVFNIGTVTGSIVVVYLKGVQIAAPQFDDGGRKFVLNFPESRAFGSSVTAKDELTLWIA